jgi:hypothetical protein
MPSVVEQSDRRAQHSRTTLLVSFCLSAAVHGFCELRLSPLVALLAPQSAPFAFFVLCRA